MQTPFPPPPGYAPFPAPQAPPREKPHYPRVAALVLSFFSANLYRDVARRWRGIGFWYLVLLLLVCTLPVAVKMQIGFSKFVRQDASNVLSGFPAVTINQGVVSIDRPEPYLWRDPETHEVFMYVDTSDAFDLPEGANAKVKLGHSHVTMQQSAVESRTYDLSQVQSFHIDKTILLGWLQKASGWIGVGWLVGGLFFGTIGHLLQILLYGVFGLAFAAMFNARLSYGSLLRLAAVAITPALILDCALTLGGVDFPYSGWLFFAIEMTYLAIAVKANAQSPVPPALVMTSPQYPPVPPPQQPPPGATW